ncbi:hypothetical protein ABD440_24715, partial [Chromobacterium piscinae]
MSNTVEITGESSFSAGDIQTPHQPMSQLAAPHSAYQTGTTFRNEMMVPEQLRQRLQDDIASHAERWNGGGCFTYALNVAYVSGDISLQQHVRLRAMVENAYGQEYKDIMHISKDACHSTFNSSSILESGIINFTRNREGNKPFHTAYLHRTEDGKLFIYHANAVTLDISMQRANVPMVMEYPCISYQIEGEGAYEGASEVLQSWLIEQGASFVFTPSREFSQQVDVVLQQDAALAAAHKNWMDTQFGGKETLSKLHKSLNSYIEQHPSSRRNAAMRTLREQVIARLSELDAFDQMDPLQRIRAATVSPAGITTLWTVDQLRENSRSIFIRTDGPSYLNIQALLVQFYQDQTRTPFILPCRNSVSPLPLEEEGDQSFGSDARLFDLLRKEWGVNVKHDSSASGELTLNTESGRICRIQVRTATTLEEKLEQQRQVRTVEQFLLGNYTPQDMPEQLSYENDSIKSGSRTLAQRAHSPNGGTSYILQIDDSAVNAARYGVSGALAGGRPPFATEHSAKQYLNKFENVFFFLPNSPHYGEQAINSRPIKEIAASLLEEDGRIGAGKKLIILTHEDYSFTQKINLSLRLTGRDAASFNKADFMRIFAGTDRASITEGEVNHWAIQYPRDMTASETDEGEIGDAIDRYKENLVQTNRDLDINIELVDFTEGNNRAQSHRANVTLEFTHQLDYITAREKLIQLCPGIESKVEFLELTDRDGGTFKEKINGRNVLILSGATDTRTSIFNSYARGVDGSTKVTEIMMGDKDHETHRAVWENGEEVRDGFPKGIDKDAIYSSFIDEHSIKNSNLSQGKKIVLTQLLSKIKEHKMLYAYGFHQVPMERKQSLLNGMYSALATSEPGKRSIIFLAGDNGIPEFTAGMEVIRLDDEISLNDALARRTNNPLVILAGQLPSDVNDLVMKSSQLVIAEGKGTISVCQQNNIRHLILHKNNGANDVVLVTQYKDVGDAEKKRQLESYSANLYSDDADVVKNAISSVFVDANDDLIDHYYKHTNGNQNLLLETLSRMGSWDPISQAELTTEVARRASAITPDDSSHYRKQLIVQLNGDDTSFNAAKN